MGDAIKSQDMKISFADMGLQIGDPLYLETLDHRSRYLVKLIGFVADQSILVLPPEHDGKQILLKKDRPFNVRSAVKNKVFAFQSSIKHLSMQPFAHLHLEYPKELVAIQVRESERVPVHIPAQAYTPLANNQFRPMGSAIIVDLSASGAAIESDQSLGNLGDQLALKFPISVSGISKSLSVRAIIRNVREIIQQADDELLPDDILTDLDTANSTSYAYGLQFIELSDTARIILNSFNYESQKRR